MAQNAEDLAAWARWCRAAGRSELTIKQRAYYISALGAAVGDLRTAGTEVLVDWLAGHTWAPETRSNARGALRSYYTWATATGRVGADPSFDIPTVRVQPGLPRPIPVPLFAEAVARANPRMRLALQLGRFAGLRRAEIAGVHRDHVEGDVLRVHGKGGKVRSVDLHPVVGWQVRALDGWAFPSRWRAGQHIEPATLGKLAREVLPQGWTLHSLRHRFGTDLYAVSRDLFAVQQLLGHSKSDTSRIYVQLADDATRRAVLGIAS